MMGLMTTEEGLREEMGEPETDHIPVLCAEVVEYLRPHGGGVFVDCTLGLGGHAQALLRAAGHQSRLIGIDRDAQSLQMAAERLKPYLSQCVFVHEDFRNIDKILRRMEIAEVDGILLDLGISSYQLDNPQRGFSFQTDGPLDMRMDQDSPISAFDLVNSLSEKEISSILKDYGEERWHNRIARYIIRQRSHHPIETTQELSGIVLKAMPPRKTWQRIHPATRTFQALRIAVNRELESLDILLDKCVDLLKAQGRIAVIAFHSLEDRIVKHKFRALAQSGKIKLVVKKPLWPSEEEAGQNPRARSARLRVAEREPH